jgi:hypothetical protein
MSAIYKSLHHSVFSSLELLPPFQVHVLFLSPFTSNAARKRVSFHLTYPLLSSVQTNSKTSGFMCFILYSLMLYVFQ